MSKLFTLPSIIPTKLNHFLPLTVMIKGDTAPSKNWYRKLIKSNKEGF